MKATKITNVNSVSSCSTDQEIWIITSKGFTMVKRTTYATFAANYLLQFMIWTTTSWNNMEKINLAAIFCKKPVHFLRKIQKETNYLKNISDISCINVTKALDYSQPFKGQERLLKAKGGKCRLTIYKYYLCTTYIFSLTF